MTSAHAKLSASGSARWSACPASVRAEAGIPDRGSSFAQEGTAAHALAEKALVNGNDCDEYVGDVLEGVLVTPDMAAHTQTYVDYVRAVPGQKWYEVRVDFSQWVPEGFGTSDAIAIEGDTIHVIDLKFGKGVKVYAQDNTQAVLYALGALEEFSYITFANAVVHIVQPRIDHIDIWTQRVDEIEKTGQWLSTRAHLALSDDPPYGPSEKACQWCKAADGNAAIGIPPCKALEKHMYDIIATDFDNLDELPNPDTMTDEQLVRIIENESLITGYLKAVRNYVTERAMRGEHVPGMKVVHGRANRTWRDESEAEATLLTLLGDDAFEKKLLSVAKAEKIAGKKNRELLSELTVRNDGKPTLVPESDKRPPISVSPEMFSCFDEKDVDDE